MTATRLPIGDGPGEAVVDLRWGTEDSDDMRVLLHLEDSAAPTGHQVRGWLTPGQARALADELYDRAQEADEAMGIEEPTDEELAAEVILPGLPVYAVPIAGRPGKLERYVPMPAGHDFFERTESSYGLSCTYPNCGERAEPYVLEEDLADLTFYGGRALCPDCAEKTRIGVYTDVTTV